ncbi:TSUP family transporter [Streptomyces ochraceiscleroticus]|uniref:Probable membrane transporter protein n=1 Tax=Streptomyces ochraceiscleroticus TaxID=47761 RepID=A0ABW1ME97_9ACTN|nr:TSUP family transporter [Streptomyces ochraceiscleroticus]
MLGLGLLPLLTLAVAALLAGFSKTALSGVAAVSVALFAAVLPAKESTGALLPLLLAGDVIAVRTYRRHADRPTLRRLFPSVAAGVLAGVAFTALADDTLIRRTIGALLLTITAHHLWQRRRRTPPARTTPPSATTASATPPPGTTASPTPAPPPGTAASAKPATALGTAMDTTRPHASSLRTPLYGLIAGFATMVANAGGPAMSLYLLASRLGMLGFLGTAAWFFFLVNAFKLPFSAALGLLTPHTLLLDAALLPALLLGAHLGRRTIHHLNQPLFTHLTLLLTTAAALNLLR